MKNKTCITCGVSRDIAEFYPEARGTIRRDCNSCREVETPVFVPVTDARERRLAREAAAPGHCTAEQRQLRWDYYQGRCWMCRKPARVMDHVKPLSRGGCSWPSNLRPACWGCNRRKAALWPLPAWTMQQGIPA